MVQKTPQNTDYSDNSDCKLLTEINDNELYKQNYKNANTKKERD